MTVVVTIEEKTVTVMKDGRRATCLAMPEILAEDKYRRILSWQLAKALQPSILPVAQEIYEALGG